ncbi:hypothetical protein H480_13084, partial [Amycolatopsis vancoresmycina DSM 44592]
GGPPPGPYQQQARPYAGGYPPAGPPAYGGPQPFPGGPPSQPFAAQPPGPQSQPFPAQPQAGRPFGSPSPGQPGEPPEPGAVSSRLDDPYGGVTQAQSHPSQQEPASPTEPNYQLPPLNPPNT